ncbi:hypothetical protein PMAYCL1PPCAC_20104 [Pristionchus mayeri]|uniref:Resistance to inhibitors of cholinesterase protein 3 N-terminal domain-containing protein n=1 Tax=Pristionchus mayeri TaxID=1317129 RepID=A0AAN5CSR8_9BILA|nr:hypothetical protein PMAYCL1PPCAC_20104 [Pristionchus mayeri]
MTALIDQLSNDEVTQMSEADYNRILRREEDEEEEERVSWFEGWRLVLVITVIILWLAAIYPPLIHPLLISLIYSESKKPTRKRREVGNQRPYVLNGSPVRPAAAIPEAAPGSPGGGANAIYAFMIPFFTISVIAFLLYVTFGPNRNRRRNRRQRNEEVNEEILRDRRRMLALQERLRRTSEIMSNSLEQLEWLQSQGLLEAMLREVDAGTSAAPITRPVAVAEEVRVFEEEHVQDGPDTVTEEETVIQDHQVDHAEEESSQEEEQHLAEETEDDDWTLLPSEEPESEQS